MLIKMHKVQHYSCPQLFCALLLTVIVQAGADIPDCEFRDTVNVTGSQRFANGSYKYEDVIIPAELIGTYDYELIGSGDRISVSLHTRGCVCKVKSCVQFCCSRNALKVKDESVCSAALDEELNYSPYVNITDKQGVRRLIHVLDEFVVQLHIPCAESFALYPEIYPDDGWELFENGTLLRLYDNKYLSKLEYCLHPENVSETDQTIYVLNPLNCAIMSPPSNSQIINSIVMIISIVFFILTILVYALIPELYNLHGKCLICHLISMTCGFILIVANTIKMVSWDENLCVFLGILCYFFLMAGFLWLSVISFDLWNNFRGTMFNSRRYTQRRKFTVYSLYAWGIALVVTALTAYAQFTVVNDCGPHFEESCWMTVDNWSAMIYFYGIVLVVIVFNTVMFTLTALKIYEVQKELKRIVENDNRETSRLGKEKDNFGLFLRMFLVMGILWLFEVLSYILGNISYMWYIFLITDFLNAAKGPIIFGLFVFKKKVYMLMKKRKLALKERSLRMSQKSTSKRFNSIANTSLL